MRGAGCRGPNDSQAETLDRKYLGWIVAVCFGYGDDKKHSGCVD